MKYREISNSRNVSYIKGKRPYKYRNPPYEDYGIFLFDIFFAVSPMYTIIYHNFMQKRTYYMVCALFYVEKSKNLSFYNVRAPPNNLTFKFRLIGGTIVEIRTKKSVYIRK